MKTTYKMFTLSACALGGTILVELARHWFSFIPRLAVVIGAIITAVLFVLGLVMGAWNVGKEFVGEIG